MLMDKPKHLEFIFKILNETKFIAEYQLNESIAGIM